MHSSAKILILIFQMLALIAIKLNLVDGTSSPLESSEKSELLPVKGSLNYEIPVFSHEMLDSDPIDLYEEDKRAQWNNLQGGWGKRGEWNKLSAAWGKRPANNWNNLSGMWGKRAAKWNELSGMWGKRGWNDMSGGWGKRTSPHWNKLRGMWGKRSEMNADSNPSYAAK